jgi:hypothetical protein
MRDRVIRQFVFIGVLLLAMGSPALAEAAERPGAAVEVRTSPAAVVLADSWSMDRLVAGGGRTRIVQVCAVVMSIALFIMMRKLH